METNLIEHLPELSDLFYFNYTTRDDKPGIYSTPVNIIPTIFDTKQSTVMGFYNIDGQQKLFPLAFSLHFPLSFPFTEKYLNDFFVVNNNGEIQRETFGNDKLYLDLINTEYLHQKCISVGNESLPLKDSPYPILGVNHSPVYPLLLVFEDKGSLRIKGISQVDNHLELFNCNNNELPNKCVEGSLEQLLYSLDPKHEYFLKPNKNKNSRCIKVSDSEQFNPQLLKTDKSFQLNSKVEDVTLEDIAEKARDRLNKKVNWEKPKEIIKFLDQYVIGQEKAKKEIAVSFYKIMARMKLEDESIKKPHMLLIGDTGVGKTYMASLLVKAAGLPFVQTSISDKSSSGYVGQNLSDVLGEFRSITDGEAPYGVIFLDEIDKLAYAGKELSGIFDSKLQNEIISWMEESTYIIDHEKNKKPSLNTKNIVFITAGAFKGIGDNDTLEDIIKKRQGFGQKRIGFETNNIEKSIINHLTDVLPEDLIAFGFKPELVGRFQTIATFHRLTNEHKIKILKESKDSVIHDFEKFLMIEGYKLIIPDKTLEVISQRCPDTTGARALNSICSNLFTEILLEPTKYAQNEIITVTPELAKELITLFPETNK